MTQATKPYRYGGFVLIPRADGSQDLIDPATGRWINLPTQRYARWTASIVSNFHTRLQQQTPLRPSAIPHPKD